PLPNVNGGGGHREVRRRFVMQGFAGSEKVGAAWPQRITNACSRSACARSKCRCCASADCERLGLRQGDQTGEPSPDLDREDSHVLLIRLNGLGQYSDLGIQPSKKTPPIMFAVSFDRSNFGTTGQNFAR